MLVFFQESIPVPEIKDNGKIGYNDILYVQAVQLKRNVKSK